MKPTMKILQEAMEIGDTIEFPGIKTAFSFY